MSLLDHFLGSQVLLVSNEPDMGVNGIMRAKFIGHTMTCRNLDCPMPLFAGEDGKQFMFGGLILPYDQRMWDFLAPMAAQERFHFLLNQFNFRADLRYALESLRPKPEPVPPPAPKSCWRRFFHL